LFSYIKYFLFNLLMLFLRFDHEKDESQLLIIGQ